MTVFTIAEAAQLMADKKLSPVELTQSCLDRVAKLDPALNSFLLVTADRALADARAAEARMMAGTSLGKLDGIPIAHKDIYNTAGIRTTAHSRLLEHNVPTADATTVRLLAGAGTVMMGKLATHEFAMGGPSFDLPWPPARNPWNPNHFTAGSSSGTGAAVAAGLVLGGTGSDTAGSIRNPSALCGITGIKPTYGLVSRSGILPLAFTLDHSGPMAWTVEDCALMLQAMAGHDPADPGSANHPIPDYTAGLNDGVAGLRIGVVRHFHEVDNRASPATIAGIDAGADILRHLGAEVRDVTLAPLMEYHACCFIILLAEAYAVHEPWLTEKFYDYGELFRDRVVMGGFLRSSDYLSAIRRRQELNVQMAAATADVDILITAAQVGEAPLITESPKWAMFDRPNLASPFNLSGYPSMAVCTGYGAGGLPVSMQIVGKPFTEATVFRVGQAYEKATTWRSQRPAMVTA
jgi:aspartyl-tRNA(Asn)/glutamyl-tRNA(Gln) amidotransferase subunit A